MDISELYQIFLRSSGITTDTRQIGQNQLFFALKGASYNGNTFAGQALDAGAAYAIIDEENYEVNERTILVKHVLQSLQELALHHRRSVNPKAVIAITGSNGKTTTKELVHAVLATTYKTHYTKGNLNNHIGVPLTLLQMPADTEIAVIEMGANHQQEIESYCTFTEPTHGIITNCGKAHLEGFGGEAGIRKGKGELYDFIQANGGTLFVNGDDPVLLDMLKQRSISKYVTYGQCPENIYFSHIRVDHPFLEIAFEDIRIHTHLYGRYNYSNIMCAVAVGKNFGVSHDRIRSAIENYIPVNSRSQMIERNGYNLISDAYNANPTSMRHALESFAKSSAAKKVVILGDMFELGEYSEAEHQQIADLCIELNFDVIVLVGNAFSKTTTPGSVLKFINAESAQAWFIQQELTGSEILLKGSRSMQMEKVVA
jgi:UDP-N-acetylmuramoyl-tripeptide--D-alanyl-D-alanine ligase